MPTPRQHGGAALSRLRLVLPGFKGLNTAQKSGVLGPEWATSLQDAVVDANSRVAARRGWDSLTTSPAADVFAQIFSHVTEAGTERVIAASETKLYSSSDTGGTWTEVTGTVTPAAGNWQFVNFTDAVYGIQQDHDLIKATTGNFAPVVDANVPSGNCILSAYGRLWAVDANGTDLRYSALLDGTDWHGTDAGVLDLTNVWPGTDTVVAIAAFNGRLVIFGSNNIVLYADPTGTPLGVDPLALIVTDIITGTGCAARDSVQTVDGDLWFLSSVGLQSLGRLLVQKSNPLNNLSMNIQDEIDRRTIAAGSRLGSTRSVYSPRHKLYLLSVPAEDGGGGVVAFDTRGSLEDGSVRCVGLWTLFPTSMIVLKDLTLVMSLELVAGEIGAYRGGLDNGVGYTFSFKSGWLDLTHEGFLIIPKRYTGTFYTDATTTVQYSWAFDFEDEFRSVSKTFVAGGNIPEFGVAEFGLAEFGGGVSLRTGAVPGNGTGQFIRLGVETNINGQEFSIQQLDIFCKVGRYA
jgi:hypothetical protein